MATSSSSINDHDHEKQDDLDRLALEEIMKETNRARERAESMGPMGWVKCPLQSTNKRFLRNILMRTIPNPKPSTSKRENAKESNGSLDASRPTSSTGEYKKEKLDNHHVGSPSEGNASKTNSGFSDRIYLKDHKLEETFKKDHKQESREQEKTRRDIRPGHKDYKSSRKHKIHHKSKHEYKRRK